MALPFIPVLLGIAAIGIGSAAASFLFQEMTEEEKRKQEKMEDDVKSFEFEQEKLFKAFQQEQNTFKQHIRTNQVTEKKKLEKTYEQKMREQQFELTQKYIQLTYEHIQQAKAIRDEIRQARDRMQAVIRQEKTPLRKEALNYLWRELQVGYERAVAYVSYLYDHAKMIKNYRFQLEPRALLFDFRLPEHYLYVGKMLSFTKEKLAEEQVLYELNDYDNCILYVTDVLEKYQLPDTAKIPLFVTEKVEDGYEVSIGKGMFHVVAIQQSKVGVQAKVRAYSEKGHIELMYKGVELSMCAKDLQNQLKVPPIGATLRVYPTSWHGLLRGKVFVSEKYEDSLRAFQFSSLPIVFNEEDAEKFIEFYEQQGQDGSADEWKIGPVEGAFFKLQLGDFFVFQVEMIAKKPQFLRFDRILSLNDAFKVDDIFVVMDAEFELVLDTEIELLSEDSHRNMFDLNMMLLKEIQIQEQLKGSKEGLNFFGKWSEVTEQLIHYLSKGSEIHCQLGEGKVELYKTPFGQLYRHKYEIVNQDEVINQLNHQVKNMNPQFFVEGQMKVEFDQINRHLFYYSGDRDVTLAHRSIVVYEREYCYPEHQQLIALETFREGSLVNAKLQPYILNGTNAQMEAIQLPTLSWKNKGLLNNATQKEAVERVLAEQNLFLIQGPPGTGKTTVIRELIHQQLALSHTARILIVSQANVAIDNVLKGLDEELSTEIIRCGKSDKIDFELQQISFDEKYAGYTQTLRFNEVSPPLQKYAQKWNDIVMNDDRSQAPIVGEIFVRNHKIVGATCLGLMQRKIGLHRVEFDLVIIDEAGKALPAELLIPINRAKKCVMIGDHKQLPPVINPALYDAEKIELSDTSYCQNELFTTSLFKRLYESLPATNKVMLNMQYRMPAVIGRMISQFFYENQLQSHESTEQRSTKYFKTHLNFLNMEKDPLYKESKVNQVITNKREGEIVVHLVQQIRTQRPLNEKIAIICPYRGQNRLIRDTFRQAGVDIYSSNISINTIDAYQGDEAEIVIYCMTRAQIKTRYFSDEARLNVAFSRVKNDLLIIGSLSYLKDYGEDHILNKIANYIEQHGDIYQQGQLFEATMNMSVGSRRY